MQRSSCDDLEQQSSTREEGQLSAPHGCPIFFCFSSLALSAIMMVPEHTRPPPQRQMHTFLEYIRNEYMKLELKRNQG